MEKTININLLRENASEIIEKQYTLPLSDNESLAAKDRLVQVSLQIAAIEEEKKETNDLFKEQLKPLKEEVSAILEELKYKARVHSGKVYLLIDHEQGRAGEYTVDGQLISDRNILPEEKQFKIKMAANGTEP